MLAHDDSGVAASQRQGRARELAEYFGSEDSYARFRTHGRPIRVEQLERLDGLRVRRLEADSQLQDAVLSVYHALDITFGGPALKIVENHLGRRKVRAIQQIVMQAAPPSTPGQAIVIPTPTGPRPPLAPAPPEPAS